jgi:NitT/TauT family transport system substrate-binding protein
MHLYRRPLRLLSLMILVAMAGLSAGPAPSPATAAAAQPGSLDARPLPQTTTLRYGSPQSITDGGVLIARARGYFQQQGISLDLVPFQTGPDAIPMMAAGELDAAGGIHSIALLNAAERGLGIKIVADKGISRPGFEFTHIVVRRDLYDSGAVRDVGDLRGRRITVASTRSGAEAVVAHVLGRGGVGIDEVTLVPLGFPDMIVAFANGAIDGASMIEPMLSVAVERGLVVAWEPGRASAAYGGIYQGGILLYASRLAAQPDLARRFMLAYLQGVRVYDDAFGKGEGRDAIVRLLAEQTTVKDPAAYDHMQIGWLDPDGRLARESIQLDLDFFRQQGYYTGTTTFDDLIDASYAEYAAQQLGAYR